MKLFLKIKKLFGTSSACLALPEMKLFLSKLERMKEKSIKAFQLSARHVRSHKLSSAS